MEVQTQEREDLTLNIFPPVPIKKYQSEVEKIRERLGELESYRKAKGLTRKEIASILMINPSTWSRWMKFPETIPPHVYRLLDLFEQVGGRPEQLGIEVRSRRSAFLEHEPYVRELLKKSLQPMREKFDSIDNDLNHLRQEGFERKELLRQMDKKESVSLAWKSLLIFNTLLLIYVLARALF